MRRIAIALTALTALLVGASGAHAATLGSFGGIIYYSADPGEKNDLTVGSATEFGGTVPLYTFKDADANPIKISGGPCELINGIGECRQEFVGSFAIDLRDRDDIGQISTAGDPIIGPIHIGALMIGGRGNDTLLGGLGNDILKGNDGRDSLRGRGGRTATREDAAGTRCRPWTAFATPSSPAAMGAMTCSGRTRSIPVGTIASTPTTRTSQNPTNGPVGRSAGSLSRAWKI